MRVLLISHTCMSRTEGQKKAVELSRRYPDLTLQLLVPDRWHHYGEWRRAEQPEAGALFGYRAEPIRFAWSGPGQWYLHHYPKLKRVLLDFKPDVIDLWEEPWGLVSAHTCYLRNRFLPNARIITETEQNVDKMLPPPFEWFRRYTLRNANFAVGRNEEAVEILRRKGYVGPAEVVPNAVDAELFRPMDRSACRVKLGVTGFVVGYVGRFVPEKGLSDLLDAVAQCPQDVNLLLIGGGPMQAMLAARAAELGCGGRVRFLPGRPQTELPELMNAMDVLALPSRTTARWKEQFGRVLIEANACGIPVIGSDSGAIPDVVGKGGLVFPEGDVAALADTIRRFIDPAFSRETGRNGRTQAESQYTWARVADRMYSIYSACKSDERIVRSSVPLKSVAH